MVRKIHKHIKHINNYDTEINYYNKKTLNKKQYYNFYHDTFNFRKIENISVNQQTDIINNITETNNQTINYVDDNYIKKDKIATIILAPTSLTATYLWIPEGITDNVVPGLESILTYIQSKYATLNALQNSITNINNTINNEISNIQTTINNIEITEGTGTVNKQSHYHSSNTDFLYQRNTTNHDNRRQFVIQNHYFTFQRQYNTNNLELTVQLMQLQIEQMQTQINNLSSSNSGGSGGGGDPDIGTMWVS